MDLTFLDVILIAFGRDEIPQGKEKSTVTPNKIDNDYREERERKEVEITIRTEGEKKKGEEERERGRKEGYGGARR